MPSPEAKCWCYTMLETEYSSPPSWGCSVCQMRHSEWHQHCCTPVVALVPRKWRFWKEKQHAKPAS